MAFLDPSFPQLPSSQLQMLSKERIVSPGAQLFAVEPFLKEPVLRSRGAFLLNKSALWSRLRAPWAPRAAEQQFKEQTDIWSTTHPHTQWRDGTVSETLPCCQDSWRKYLEREVLGKRIFCSSCIKGLEHGGVCTRWVGQGVCILMY